MTLFKRLTNAWAACTLSSMAFIRVYIVPVLVLTATAGVTFAQEITSVMVAPAAQQAEVPDAQKAEAARAIVEKIREAEAAVSGLVEEARKDMNVMKLNCVNARLSAIKGFAKVSEQADVALNQALDAGNSERAGSQFQLLSMAGDKVSELRAEAYACVGESFSDGSDTTELSVEVDENIVPETTDPTIIPPEIIIEVEQPPEGSPYR